MSAYERERAEHIARNRERMAALQLPSLAHNVAPKKEARPAKQRGISSKRHKALVSSLYTSSLQSDLFDDAVLLPDICPESTTLHEAACVCD